MGRKDAGLCASLLGLACILLPTGCNLAPNPEELIRMRPNETFHYTDWASPKPRSAPHLISEDRIGGYTDMELHTEYYIGTTDEIGRLYISENG